MTCSLGNLLVALSLKLISTASGILNVVSSVTIYHLLSPGFSSTHVSVAQTYDTLTTSDAIGHASMKRQEGRAFHTEKAYSFSDFLNLIKSATTRQPRRNSQEINFQLFDPSLAVSGRLSWPQPNLGQVGLEWGALTLYLLLP